ncbi:MAG: terminase family protein, partial [Planctomycetaceae bacterium]
MTTATAPAPINIRPHRGPQERFLGSPADVVVYGGAAGGGKSFALLLETLRHVANPRFGAVVFRRTCPEITNEGGLWDEANSLYPMLGATSRIGHLDWTFPSGASVSFCHMQHEDDRFSWQGAQVPLICFDELTHFTERQFFYLLTRNRSTCGVRPYIRATTNPDADSWVAKFIAWWINPITGYPIPQRDGIVRWFVRVDEQLIWSDDPEELRREHPEQMPKSVTFISAKLEDNPTLLRKDPGYRANLLAQSRVDRERLLGGNWRIQDVDGAEWEDHPEYFGDHLLTNHWPDRFELSAMAIDPSKGATEKSDYSAIVYAGVTSGLIWLDADVQRRPAERIVDDGIGDYLLHGPAVVGIEANTF